MTAKRTKASVHYSLGMRGHRCGECAHYRNRRCALVAGAIDPSYWCKLFKRKA